jgi:hypothetical protein
MNCLGKDDVKNKVFPDFSRSNLKRGNPTAGIPRDTLNFNATPAFFKPACRLTSFDSQATFVA